MESDLLRGPGCLNTRTLSTLINRNITVCGKRTSIRLERSMWRALEEICFREDKVMNQLATEIAQDRSESSLTASIRVYVMEYFRAAASEDGHQRAGHGDGAILKKTARARSRAQRLFLLEI